MPAASRLGQVFQLLGQHVARPRGRAPRGCRPGRRPARRCPWRLAAASETALSKASGPSSTPPVICPRSAILHSAAASSVERDLRADGFDGRQDRHPRLGDPQDMRQVDGVLDDVALVLEVGIDVDRRVGDEERPRVSRRVHHKDMADAAGRCAGPRPRSTTACISSSVCRLPFISASTLPARARATAAAGGRVAVFGSDDFVGRKIDRRGRGGCADLGLRTDQHRDDQLRLGGVHRAEQRGRIDRMDDGGTDRLQPPAQLDQLAYCRPGSGSCTSGGLMRGRVIFSVGAMTSALPLITVSPRWLAHGSRGPPGAIRGLGFRRSQ